jgi:protocatechuate 3,4-dioxygenase beta subunit
MTSQNIDVPDRSDNDDAPIGQVLSRREVLALVGATGLVACAPSALTGASPTAPSAAATAAGTAAATAAAAATAGAPVAVPSCIVRPAVTEGPYFVDEKLNRSDIRSDPSNGAVKAGAAFVLTFTVAKVASVACVALANAQVDIWHCDAAGVYSDATDPSFNTKGQKFLRGYQLTDSNGRAAFTTIYPGWYQGRAVHIHFKIRTTAANGSVSDFTSQLFFDDALNSQVFATAPYSSKGTGWMKNSQDGIYTGGGDKLLLKPTAGPSGSSFAATFDIGLA